MENFYKYLPLSEEDENWGLSVLNTGCTSILAKQGYPPEQHPEHHYFNWDTGRILNEYQVIYISAGQGLFESSGVAQQTVYEGSIIFLFPGEWHRFKPVYDTGWNEHWVGCKGDVIDNLIKKNFFHPEDPVQRIGLNEDILIIFNEIIEHTKSEKPGYQPLISGAVLHLLGSIHSLMKQQQFDDVSFVEVVVNKARFLLRSRINEDINIKEMAEELCVSYAWFRKMFKQYTGIAPQQYFIQLKIEKAKTLLRNPLMPVKAVAYELNFESPFYFSKLFKEKAGVSPEQYKKKYMTSK